MPNNSQYTNFILEDKEKISDVIGKISNDLYNYMINDLQKESTWVMFYKTLSHSDLATFGKSTEVGTLKDNWLYYIKETDMKDIENKTGKPFPTAHQSCIGLSIPFYNKIGLPNPRDKTQYLINDYMKVMLVNSNIKYFTSYYTKMVFDKLGKSSDNRRRSWDFSNLDVKLSSEQFTEIPLEIARHGIGMQTSTEFHKLRHHMFKSDTFILLCEMKQNGSKVLYIVLEKNPLFFSIIGEANRDYVAYQERTRQRLISQLTRRDNAVSDEDIEEEVTRQQQSTWRKMLANEMMGYTQEINQVFCPFTYISANFGQLGTLFVASHIKGFKDPNTSNEEKFDVNNGLLLCANADALFDKHLISVNENKELVFSYLMDDQKLKAQLLLMFPIFQPILNENRMKYLNYHFEVFKEKERERKQVN